MTRHVLLDNVEHRDLRVDVTHQSGPGEDVMMVPTFPAEFRSIQACHPIVYRQTTEATFAPMALLGFREGQNLSMKDGVWDAGYVPLFVARQPFLIGEDVEGRPVMHIDLDHPAVGTIKGEPLFREHGGQSDLLMRANSMLRALHEGAQATSAFVESLQRLDLLEPLALEIPCGRDERLRVAGLHVIDEERLCQLDGGALEALHQQGYLQAVYMCLASLSRIPDMIDRFNRHG